MRRRAFISLLGGAAAWPLAARAQRSAMPVIGYFSNSRWKRKRILLQFFRKGLAEFGYVINESATIELRCRNSLGYF
jgi:putative tryptophan/tyrosine transport system substrate-binding protein